MDLSRQEILAAVDRDAYDGIAVDLQQELPEEVKECEKSIREDNPDMDRSTAIAICRDQLDMRDTIDLQDDPCQPGWTMVGTKEQDGQTVPNCVPADEIPDADMADAPESDCPDGQVHIRGDCIPIETVEAPPTMLSESLPTPVHLEEFDPEAIERIEESDGRVRYTNIKLIGPGHWTDSNSRQTVHYSPEAMRNLEVTEDNTVHIFHDSQNDTSEVGFIDPESVENAENGVFGDLVIETDNAAGEFADENMQTTLETGGADGFGGPSVEIPEEGQEIEFNAAEGIQELRAGKIDAVGLVKNPAAKDVHFARQTANAAVALSDSQTVMLRNKKERHMADVSTEEVAEFVASHYSDLDTADVMDAVEEGGEFEGLDMREVAALVANAVDASTGDVLEAFEQLNGGDGMEMQEFDVAPSEIADAVSQEVSQRAGEDMSESEARADIIDDLATEANRDESTISDIIDGEIDTVPDEVVRAAANVLDVDQEDLGSDIEESDMDMEQFRQRVDSMEERLTNMEDMVESAMAASEAEEMLSDELETVRDELADAETVAELADAKEELERRLSELEDEEKPPRSLKDGGGDNEDIDGTLSEVKPTARHRY